MHISCDAFTEICAFTVHVTECIHSAFNVLHYCALLCIYNSLHSWLLHSVACACILDYLHSRRVAFMCILSPPCILMHSERGAFLQLYIHRTCACIQWLCISIVMHYDAFGILCILGCCIPLHLVASCVICIHDLAHINAYDRIQLRAALLCMWDSCIIMHLWFYAFLLVALCCI